MTWGKYHIPADLAILVPVGLIVLAVLLLWLMVIISERFWGNKRNNKHKGEQK